MHKDRAIEVLFTVNGIEVIKISIYEWLPHVDVVEP